MKSFQHIAQPVTAAVAAAAAAVICLTRINTKGQRKRLSTLKVFIDHDMSKITFKLSSSLVPKIQQTKMLVTCQRFGDLFLFGLIWQYSSNQKNIIKVGSKS